MNISMKREALLERLADRLAVAKAEDERIKAKHAKDEETALREFRRVLQRASKWSYAELKKNSFEAVLPGGKIPHCPTPCVNQIIRAIQYVKLDTRSAPFVIVPRTDIHAAVNWEPESRRLKASIC